MAALDAQAAREHDCTNLGSLLGASLSLRERGRSHLLSGLGGLSLRKEDISIVLFKATMCLSLNSNETTVVAFQRT